MNLPDNVRRISAKGGRYVYYVHQIRKGGVKTKAVRIPFDPADDRFWREAALLNGATARNGGTIAELVALYRASPAWRTLKPKSQTDYTRYLEEFIEYYGNYTVAEIDAPALAAIRDGYGDRLSSANHFLSVVKTLYSWATDAGHAPGNPARDVKRHKIKSDGAKPWSAEALQAGLTAADWRIRLFIALGLYTGQRTEDIVQMTLHDFRGGRIAVIQAKTGKRLSIRIHERLKPFIDEAHARGEIVLFPSATHGKMTGDLWRGYWHHHRDASPLKEIHAAGYSPHGLRKSATCELRNVGCSDAEIGAITGMSPQMVKLYTAHIDQQILADRALDRWEK